MYTYFIKVVDMKKIFQIDNVKCGGCASTLTKQLQEEFGEVKVNLEKEPREIILEIDDNQIDNLKIKLKKLGYPLIDDKLTTFETVTTKAKSFVSCAIGKMDTN